MQFIDAHNHSLPGIDDGAKNMDTALEMLRVAEQNGTAEIVLTPHHLNGAFLNYANDIKNKTKELKTKAKEAGLSLELHTASEVHLTPETVEHLMTGKALTYCEHGKAALIELPKHTIPTGAETILNELIHHKITPIIAHPERNSTIKKDLGPLREWIGFGCKAQITGQSCTGAFGEDLKSVTQTMISEGLVHLVASDAHRPRGRSPKLTDAAKSIVDQFDAQTCATLIYENPKRLIEGKDLLSLAKAENQQSPKKKKSWFSRSKH